MNKIITFIKNDFVNVRAHMSYAYGRNIPLGLFIPYYIIIGLIALPMLPFIWLYYRIKTQIILWSLKI